jgi:N-acetylmuramoyl-L-alanine amidase
MAATEPRIARGMDDAEVLARTVWAEARNGGVPGMENVAQVILNRARNPRWWGRSPRDVCLARMQFSCWWVADRNQREMLAVDGSVPSYQRATEIAERALAGGLGADRTKGADHYYAPAGMAGGKPPRWADEGKFTLAQHGHRFYRLELPAPGDTPRETPKSYATVTATAAAGAVATAAQGLAGLEWQVGVALIAAVAIGLLVWRFVLAKRDDAA